MMIHGLFISRMKLFGMAGILRMGFLVLNMSTIKLLKPGPSIGMKSIGITSRNY